MNYKYVVYTMMLASFLNPFASSSLNMSFPDMMREFHASTSDVGWLVEIFLLTCTVCIIPSGRLADIYGKRKLFFMGSIVFTIVSILLCFANSLYMLMAFRAIQGVALGMVFTTSMSILTLSVPKEVRGKAFGMIGATVYIGLSLGPVLGGLLNYYTGWRSIFAFTALLGVIGNVMAYRYLKEEWIDDPKGSINYISLALYVLSVGGIMTGLTELLRSSWGLEVLIGGIILLIIFIFHEWRTDNPLVPIRIFSKSRTFSASSVAAMLNFSATFGMGFLLSLYLQMLMGFDSKNAGFVLMIQTLIMAVWGPRMGAKSDHVEPTRLAGIGMLVSGLGLSLMSYATGHESLGFIIASLVVVGFGFGTFSAPNNNAIMSSVPKEYVGFASSMISSMRLMGQTLSMAMIGTILSRTAIGYSGTALLQHNIMHAFLLFGGICFVGIIPAVLGKVRD